MTEYQSLALSACRILDNKKALNIVCLDISEMTIIADYFVICSGRNPAQVKALYDELEDRMAEMGHPILRGEGYAEGRWVVMDFGVLIVHIFHEPEREFYHLERLWEDGSNRVPFTQEE